ncbi:MAG: hypothetical protein IJT51_07315, partial [Bacteroidales bacterium]|nr:hypothetical protein [Bacteroidales bacterium]
SYPNNSTGFDARPAGYVNSYTTDFRYSAYYWSATQYNASNSYSRGLNYSSATVSSVNRAKYYGMSVRCVKD